jgi:hypothetical protein
LKEAMQIVARGSRCLWLEEDSQSMRLEFQARSRVLASRDAAIATDRRALDLQENPGRNLRRSSGHESC